MNEERLKGVNIYSFNDENYVSLTDYALLQQRIDKAIKLLDDCSLEKMNLFRNIEQAKSMLLFLV